MNISDGTIEQKIIGWSDVVRHISVTVTFALIPVMIVYLLFHDQPVAAILVSIGRLASGWTR